MPTSAARIEANRRNCLKSTGPSSPSGKERSRGNALKHGLCSKVVGLEAPEAVRERAEGLAADFSQGPSSFGQWLVNQVATLGLRVEHAQAMQESTRARLALRAERAWEDDRRLEAALLGGQIAGKPDQVVERLRRTPQGCEWLISRWAMLARVADQGQGWTVEQATLAFHLLGTPLDFRQGVEPGTETGPDGLATAPDVDPATLARHQVVELQERIEVILELDEADRQAARAGLADDAELKRLRRYETSLLRQLR